MKFTSTFKIFIFLSTLAFCGCRPPDRPVPTGQTAEALALIDNIQKELERPTPDLKIIREDLRQLREHIETSGHERAELQERLAACLKTLQQIEGAVTAADLEIRFFSRLIDSTDSGRLDALLMAVTPRDAAGNPLKAPGGWVFELCKKNLWGGAGEVLQKWTFTPEQAQEHWKGQTAVYPAFEFQLTVEKAALEGIGRQGYVRVSFEPVMGKPLGTEYLLDVKRK